MSVALVSISPDATVAEAARRMHHAPVKRLPVIGEGGRLAYDIDDVEPLLRAMAYPEIAP
jgi:CBS domain-containing protein